MLVILLSTRNRVDELSQELTRLRKRVMEMEKGRAVNPSVAPDAASMVDAPVATPAAAPHAPVNVPPVAAVPPPLPAGPSWPLSDEASSAAPALVQPLDLSADVSSAAAMAGDERARAEIKRKAAMLRRLGEYKSQQRSGSASGDADEPVVDEAEAVDEGEAADEAGAGAAAGASTESSPAKPAGLSWEERFGARLPVWIGAVALALAGVFLVRYFSEIGLLGPAVRVSLAAAGGLAMLAIGEFLRKNQARIAHGLTAAGVAVLYAALFSAVRLHALVQPGVGFVLLIAITAAAIMLSLRHGPFVALLGLVGGFLMPGLLSTSGGNAAQLYSYLIMLEVGLIILTRARRWWWIGTLTMVAGFAWAVAWLVLWHNPAESAWVGAYLLGSIAVFVVAMIDSDSTAGSSEEAGFLRVLPWAAAGVGMLLVAWLLHTANFTTLEWAYFGVLSAGCMVLARIRPAYFTLCPAVALMTMVMLAAWADGLAGADTGRFLATLAAMAALHIAGCYACMWGSGKPDQWALVATLAAVVAFLIGLFGVDARVMPVSWWVIAAVMTAVLSAMATPVHMRRDKMAGRTGGTSGGDDALAVLVAGAAFFGSFAAHLFVNTHELGRQWVTIALAIQVPLLAWLIGRLRLPQLVPLVGLLAGLVAVRLLINPYVLKYDFGTTIVLNGIWYVFGVPLACFALAAWRLKRGGHSPELAKAMGVGAVVLTVAMIAMLVRHGFHAGDMGIMGSGTFAFEFATYAATLGAAGIAILHLGRRWEKPEIAACGLMAIGIMVVAAIGGAGLVRNPIDDLTVVGPWPVVNGMLYFYGLPAILAVIASRELQRHKPLAEMATVVAGVAAVLTLGLVAMQVRHGFAVVIMARGGVRLFEYATYSAAFGLTGLAMLLAARRWPGPVLEHAGAAAIVLMLACSTIGAGFVENPLYEHRAVGGTPIVNGLLYLYGLPSVLCIFASRMLRRHVAFKGLADITYICMLLLFFALVTLQVRQAFGGTYLDEHLTTNSEWYAYSAVWLLYAATLLTLGITLNRSRLRWASLAVLLLAVAKVFLFDTRHLEQLWRVLSFFGLGVSLMIIAWVYQRFVFRKSAG